MSKNLNEALVVPAPASFKIILNKRRETLSYAKLFGIEHRLWMKRKFKTALQVFEQLATVSDRGPRAQIFIAHCQVMLNNYAACSATLHRALPSEKYGDTGTQLHDAFVLWRVGLFLDAKKMLVTLASSRPDLPSISLVVADLLRKTHAIKPLKELLQQAIDNDRPNGAVAAVAHAALAAMAKS